MDARALSPVFLLCNSCCGGGCSRQRVLPRSPRSSPFGDIRRGLVAVLPPLPGGITVASVSRVGRTLISLSAWGRRLAFACATEQSRIRALSVGGAHLLVLVRAMRSPRFSPPCADVWHSHVLLTRITHHDVRRATLHGAACLADLTAMMRRSAGAPFKRAVEQARRCAQSGRPSSVGFGAEDRALRATRQRAPRPTQTASTASAPPRLREYRQLAFHVTAAAGALGRPGAAVVEGRAGAN